LTTQVVFLAMDTVNNDVCEVFRVMREDVTILVLYPICHPPGSARLTVAFDATFQPEIPRHVDPHSLCEEWDELLTSRVDAIEKHYPACRHGMPFFQGVALPVKPLVANGISMGQRDDDLIQYTAPVNLATSFTGRRPAEAGRQEKVVHGDDGDTRIYAH
jgi:hypothetical protein